jgi:hypothetical protein
VRAVVVDTNVVLVANGQHPEVSPACVAECATRLEAITKGIEKFVLDYGRLIIQEYQNKTDHRTGKRSGDAFVKWALRNTANPKHVDQVLLQEHADRSFESFPDERDLKKFDPSDRKFIAVACAHAHKPAILQATDSKWLDWAEPLKQHGITVEFICQDDIARFHTSKFGS